MLVLSDKFKLILLFLLVIILFTTSFIHFVEIPLYTTVSVNVDEKPFHAHIERFLSKHILIKPSIPEGQISEALGNWLREIISRKIHHTYLVQLTRNLESDP